jgi:thiol-disulfide isomerase/thioredoxin
MRRILGFLLLLVSVTALSLEITSEQLGQMKDLSGKAYDSGGGKDLKLIYFWATWCPSCKEKMKGPLKDVAKWPWAQLLLVSTEKDLGLVKNFVEKEDISFDIFADVTKSVRKSLGITAVPAWALLRRKGNSFEVLDSDIGFDEAKILKHRPLLSEEHTR